MVPSSSTWSKKQENPVVIFRFLFPLLFVARSDEDSLPNTGRSSACTDTLPEAQEQWEKGYWCLVVWIYLSLLFHSAEDCSSISCCNSIISQTKEAQTESIICSSWVSFLFLSQSPSTEEALATSSALVFCHGKKIETQEQENMVLL